MQSDDNDDFDPASLPIPSEDDPSEEDGEKESDEITKPTLAAYERRSNRQLWLISYSDFITILMIFFLAMYGYTYLAKMTLLKAQKANITYSEFANRVEDFKKKLGNQLKVQEDVDKVVIQLAEQILFPSGSAVLSPEAAPTLEELANSIKLVEGDVIVEGHTDNVPIHAGRFKSNWELSSARAFSVINELTRRGVPPARLAAWGFGENRPLVDNATAENRAANRRIEVVVLKKKHVA